MINPFRRRGALALLSICGLLFAVPAAADGLTRSSTRHAKHTSHKTHSHKKRAIHLSTTNFQAHKVHHSKHAQLAAQARPARSGFATGPGPKTSIPKQHSSALAALPLPSVSGASASPKAAPAVKAVAPHSSSDEGLVDLVDAPHRVLASR
jgi:hypothetical protein